MLALLLPIVAAQQSECRSAYGTTVCGYHCEAAFGTVACARTPEGRCEAAYGKVTCWDPPTSGEGAMRSPLVKARCHAAYGKVSCGYGCVEGFGEVRCAATPQGRCVSDGGKVTCWDPPGAVAVAPSTAWPQADCRTAYGSTVCGYDCVAAFGTVKCAQTPYGACMEAYGQVTCWDPDAATRGGHAPQPEHGGRSGVPLSKATCEAAYGEIACGYGCAQGYGEVKCAATPQGRCMAGGGAVSCWDPPSVQGVVVPHRGDWSEAACRADYGQTTCGYDCVAAYGEVKCAQTPFGACHAAYGEVLCWDPPVALRQD